MNTHPTSKVFMNERAKAMYNALCIRFNKDRAVASVANAYGISKAEVKRCAYYW